METVVVEAASYMMVGVVAMTKERMKHLKMKIHVNFFLWAGNTNVQPVYLSNLFLFVREQLHESDPYLQ